jgi:hypothetical protein
MALALPLGFNQHRSLDFLSDASPVAHDYY